MWDRLTAAYLTEKRGDELTAGIELADIGAAKKHKRRKKAEMASLRLLCFFAASPGPLLILLIHLTAGAGDQGGQGTGVNGFLHELHGAVAA